MSFKKRPVPASVKRAIKGDFKQPNLAELAAAFFEAAGGTRTVARLLYDEFSAADAGSLMRQRILEMILRVTKAADDKMTGPRELGILSEEDLLAEAQEIISRARLTPADEPDDTAGPETPSDATSATSPRESSPREPAPGPARPAPAHPTHAPPLGGAPQTHP